MNGDEMNRESNGDDFWGATPDWTGETPRARRTRRSGPKSDVTGAIKNLWASAMTAGADATREHRVIDATAADSTVGSERFDHQMFDDLDLEFDHEVDDTGLDLGRDLDRDVDDATGHPTTEVPVIDVFDEGTLAKVAPAAPTDRDQRRGAGGLDPLLVRVGAVAIATTLLVPLAIGLTSDGDDSDTLTSATTDAVVAAPAFDGAPNTDAGNAPTPAAGTPAGLDPDSLPPAVPVNQDPPRATVGTAAAVDADESAEVVNETAASQSVDSNDSSSGSSADVMEGDTSDVADDVTESDAPASTADGVDEPASAGDDAERVSNCAIDYTVVAGDFWLRLAEAAGVPLAELLEANGASVNTPLYPGTEICLPAGSTTPAAPTTQTPSTTTDATTTTTTTSPPTTTAPTTTEPPTTTNPNTDATPDEVKQIIRDVWPDDLEERALEIAFRESRYVPTAQNFCCYGIFQIYWNVHKSWLADIGITSDQQLFDPETNARAAYALYQRAGGWGPWSQTAY